MKIKYLNYFSEFVLFRETNKDEIRDAGIKLNFLFPKDFCEFHLNVGSGEGIIGDHCLVLWDIRKIVDFKVNREIAGFVPNLLIFGSTGGGEGFAFDMTHKSYAVFMIPFVDMNLSSAVKISDSFTGLLDRMINEMDLI